MKCETISPYVRNWSRWFLIVFLLVVKCYVFDYIIAKPDSVSWEWTDYLVKTSAAIFLALPVLLTSRRYPVFVILCIVDLWMIINIIYYRAYHLFITWHLFSLTGNMSGFWDSIWPYCTWSLLIFPLLTLPACVCFLWKSERARWYEICATLLAVLVLSLGGSYERWKRHHSESDGSSIRWEWINPCIVPESLSAHISESEKQTNIYIRHHSILSYPLYMLYDAIDTRIRHGHPDPLTKEDEAELRKMSNALSPEYPVQENLLIILAESFESWLMDAHDAEGNLVCPALNEYIRTHPVLYVKDVSTQIGYGMSGDGQMIVNTGLYPTIEGVACVDYGYNVYPNLAHFYPHSAIVNPCRNVWNQTVISSAYGYRQLIEPESDNQFEWNDSVVVDKIMESFLHMSVPSCVMGITISGHIPFDSSPDDIPLSDSIPILFRHYMQTAHFTDRQIGRLLSWADTADVMQNSVIVFTGDHRIFHAWLNDEVREYGLRANLPFGTSQAGCPLIIRSTNMDTTKIIEQARQVDIFPTILDFIGENDYFWKGMGYNLLTEVPEEDIATTSLRRRLSDKLIRLDYFKDPYYLNAIRQSYIAHAGGSINTHLYSNSIEAVRSALQHKMEFIELDLCITSDDQLVAWHDWNFEWTHTPSHEEFMSRKIYGHYTPIDFARIDSILNSNPQLSLVTDKISDPGIIDRWFHNYKQRLWVECFSESDYFGLQEMGYHVLFSSVPPRESQSSKGIRNYTFNRLHCPDLSNRDGDCFALFGGEISQHEADSLFAVDPRIRFVYIDYYNE